MIFWIFKWIACYERLYRVAHFFFFLLVVSVQWEKRRRKREREKVESRAGTSQFCVNWEISKDRSFQELQAEMSYCTSAPHVPQTYETLLSKCEIPIIDLAHMGKPCVFCIFIQWLIIIMICRAINVERSSGKNSLTHTTRRQAPQATVNI